MYNHELLYRAGGDIIIADVTSIDILRLRLWCHPAVLTFDTTVATQRRHIAALTLETITFLYQVQ